ncbi:hypothetical protein JG687_00010300 [Phytophthora cactorum]|uniref:Uncharacterized protein n=1 Tax=Phytophthora cactorum TaxID=29920 RepID=A0A8T1U9X4_9STRA|nr:hypothetical protein JG687_00010300 [Phytophthora cactorum]
MDAHAQDTATQQEIQYKLAEQLASQEDELDELRSQHSKSSSPTQPHLETNEGVAKLESELSSLSEQLESAKAKLEASNTEAGDEMNALRSEKCALEERLSTQRVQLEELQAKQCAAVAAFEEEKRVLTSELSALKSGQSDAMARCNEKDERVAQLESELSSLSEQLESAKAKLEASNTEAGDEMNALRSEKCALEERLSTQRVQLEELQAKQCAAVAAFEEEKRVLTSELSALKSGQSDAINNGIAKDTSVKVIGVGLERSAADQSDYFCLFDAIDSHHGASDNFKPKPVIPLRAFSLAFTRDRSEIEAEQRRINEANLLKRRLRRQNRQRQT